MMHLFLQQHLTQYGLRKWQDLLPVVARKTVITDVHVSRKVYHVILDADVQGHKRSAAMHESWHKLTQAAVMKVTAVMAKTSDIM